MKTTGSVPLKDIITEILSDPKVKAKFDTLESRGFSIRSIPFTELRKEKNLSQAEMAKRMGTTQNQISKIEQGGNLPTLETLDKIGEALDMDIEIVFRTRS